MKKQWFMIAMLVAFVASLALTSLAPVAQAANDIRVSLKGSAQYPNAKGTAKYKDRGGEQEFQVEVENVKKLAGKKLSVFVNGNKVGTMQINQFGAGRLELNSDQGDKVPAIRGGSKVKVKTGSGVLVVSGSF